MKAFKANQISKIKFANFFLFVAIASLQISCATTEKISSGIEVITQSEYENILATQTDHIQNYEGLYNTLEVTATLENSKIISAQNSQSARLYLWDKIRFETEAKKREEKAEKETEVFLSFYTPERKNDDLAKNKTLWKIFLDVDGKRYEGKAAKVKLVLSEINALYPYHTRFATPYVVSFPVSTKVVDGKAVKLIVTGAPGSATLNFSPL